MIRISNVPIKNQRMPWALTQIFGIGITSAKKICEQLHIPEGKMSDNLSSSEIINLDKIVSTEYKVEGDLQREIDHNIKRKTQIRKGK